MEYFLTIVMVYVFSLFNKYYVVEYCGGVTIDENQSSTAHNILERTNLKKKSKYSTPPPAPIIIGPNDFN